MRIGAGIRRALRRNTAPVPVRLYSRPGCHLCDNAGALLMKLSSRYPLTLEVVDITPDPELVRLYDIEIPVVQIGDMPPLKAPIREADLRARLETARRNFSHQGAG